MGVLHEVTDTTFQNEVLESEKLTMVDFWAPWCMPCRMMTPILEKFAGEHSDKVKIVKLNTDHNQVTSAKYGIMSIPSLLFFHKGREVKRTIGVQPAEALKAELDNLIERNV